MKANAKLFTDNRGVTPVIGVMLMIVVTVILAAAVSAYSGSINTKESAPQASFSAEASYADGYVELSHLGGDTLYKANTKIEIAYDTPTTSGYVNMGNVTFTPESNYLRPGDVATIAFNPTTGWKGGQADFKGDDISLTIYIGSPFKLTVIDTESGQTVYSAKVIMNP